MASGDYNLLGEFTAAAKLGDVDAYGRIVELTQQITTATVRRIVDDPHDSEDVVQEVYLRAFRGLADLRDVLTLVAWLQRIARSTALDFVRRRRWTFAHAIDITELPAIADDAPGIDSRSARLSRAMLTLSENDRGLCEKYYHGGWSTARLATEHKCTPVVIRKRLQRIRDRLRKEMTMNEMALPQKIVELLSKPNLTALPENPVGAIWTAFRASHDDCEEITLPEQLDSEQVVALFSKEALDDSAGELKKLEQQNWLRADLTLPMLLAAQKDPDKKALIATGKTYRLGETEGPNRLQAFHQAEVLLIGDNVEEWDMMGRIAAFIDQIVGGAKLQILQVDYLLYCNRGWEVEVQRDGDHYEPVCGWGRIRDELVSKLGHDPAQTTAVGIGMGLEQLAGQKYNIDDIRKIASMKI
ncbi:MAG: sigma-70 family RNA polymerase sigma factor [Proteobacteria bacterium]|nr:sigma-70 family RNA polymerase sigma factor [Pseudomonadota bacterium]